MPHHRATMFILRDKKTKKLYSADLIFSTYKKAKAFLKHKDKESLKLVKKDRIKFIDQRTKKWMVSNYGVCPERAIDGWLQLYERHARKLNRETEIKQPKFRYVDRFEICEIIYRPVELIDSSLIKANGTIYLP